MYIGHKSCEFLSILIIIFFRAPAVVDVALVAVDVVRVAVAVAPAVVLAEDVDLAAAAPAVFAVAVLAAEPDDREDHGIT